MPYTALLNTSLISLNTINENNLELFWKYKKYNKSQK